jgi:hypothetical protein
MLMKKTNFDPERLQFAKKLKANDDFAPCPVNDGDELYPNGIFIFNITKMIDFLKANPTAIENVEVEVSDFPIWISSINKSHVDSVDVSLPVIIAEISPGIFHLIDGNHRMEKARRMGIEKISAYKFYVEQHLNFLTEKKAYYSYIDYWNGKCPE